MSHIERKIVRDHRPDVLKGSLQRVHHWNTEDPSTRGGAKRARRKVETKQLVREAWRSCIRDNVMRKRE